MVKDDALATAALGLRVFEVNGAVSNGKGAFVCTCGKLLCRDQAKHPRFSGWQQRASSDPQVVASMFDGEAHLNYGVVTGEKIIVVDVDGEEGAAAIKNLGGVPASWTVRTSKGGHIYLATPPGMIIPGSVGKIAAKVDIRGRGNFVVGAGSTHISDVKYEWVRHPRGTPLAPVPEWLIRAATMAPGGGLTAGAPADPGVFARICRGVNEGERNHSAARLVGYLLRRYVDIEVTLNLVMAVNRERFNPPLDDDEIKAIVVSIGASEIRRREASPGR